MSESPVVEPPALPGSALYRDPSFLGMVGTQFLAVFNDNFYKQSVMLLCVERAGVTAGESLQGQATILFSIPFILLSGYCGYLSDLISKRTIIVIAKLAEIAIMLLGLAGFYSNGFGLMFLTLFLLGVHSTLYSPAKYGFLPELFRKADLPRVNGLFQMTMFFAIILGIWAAGTLLDLPGDSLWIVSTVCMVVAAIGFVTALMIRPMPAAHPELKFDPSNLILNRETRRVLFADRRLWHALLATSMFWTAGGLLYPLAINDLGLKQLGLSKSITSYMAAGTGAGIAIGCVIGMKLSSGVFNARLVRFGAWGMLAGLILLALPGSQQGTLLGFGGSCVVLVALGICAGLYSVPLQALVQALAPPAHKGRIIGAMNLANWIGIFGAGALYLVVRPLVVARGLPGNLMFLAGALCLLPVVLLYHPRTQPLGEEGRETRVES